MANHNPQSGAGGQIGAPIWQTRASETVRSGQIGPNVCATRPTCASGHGALVRSKIIRSNWRRQSNGMQTGPAAGRRVRRPADKSGAGRFHSSAAGAATMFWPVTARNQAAPDGFVQSGTDRRRREARPQVAGQFARPQNRSAPPWRAPLPRNSPERAQDRIARRRLPLRK